MRDVIDDLKVKAFKSLKGTEQISPSGGGFFKTDPVLKGGFMGAKDFNKTEENQQVVNDDQP